MREPQNLPLFEQLLAQHEVQSNQTYRLLNPVDLGVVGQVVERDVGGLRELVQLRDLRELLK